MKGTVINRKRAASAEIKNTSKTKEQYLPKGFPFLNFSTDGVEIIPGGHAFDGSYIEQQLMWNGIHVKIESAYNDDELLLLITPLQITEKKFFWYVEGGILRKRSGTVVRKPNTLLAKSDGCKVEIFSTHEINDICFSLKNPYLSFIFNSEIGFSTGNKRSLT